MSLDQWRGKLGDQYTTRNRYGTRRNVWDDIIPGIGNLLEIGANVGRNLEAIHEIDPSIELWATEPNDLARCHLTDYLLYLEGARNDPADSLSFGSNTFDCVLTCGVLIHIPTYLLAKSMNEIFRVSNRYIICAEYFAPKEEMIRYQGQDNLLWRRDYGSLYQSIYPELKCIDVRFWWKPSTGMDNLTVWLFEKKSNGKTHNQSKKIAA